METNDFTSQINLADGILRPHSLVFVSHARRPPFLPRPTLEFDLRTIGNPPKHIRDAYDGRSKHLRDHMLSNGEFMGLLRTAKVEIEEKIFALMRGNVGECCQQPTAECCENSMLASDKHYIASKLTSYSGENELQLVVGCCCERGKHRSVAFAEELSRADWPSAWEVEIYHRDVDEDRKKASRQRNQERGVKRGKGEFVALGAG